MTYLHIWKSHITHEGVMSHTSKSRHTYKWDTSKTKTISIDGMKSMSPNSMYASFYAWLQHTATHCNTLQHTATHYNTLQHTGPRWPRLYECVLSLVTATHCKTLQHSARHRLRLCEWLMSHVEYVTLHIWMNLNASRHTYMNESCPKKKMVEVDGMTIMGLESNDVRHLICGIPGSMMTLTLVDFGDSSA